MEGQGGGSDGASRSGHRRVIPAAKRHQIGERSASEANAGSIGAAPLPLPPTPYRTSGEWTGVSRPASSARSSSADGCSTPVGIDQPSRRPSAVTIAT
jgi:hypothetical protein